MPMLKMISFLKKRRVSITLMLVVIVSTVLLVHFGSEPRRYDLRINDVSPMDIEAPRSIIDINASRQRALEAKAQAPDVYSRSEDLSQRSLQKVYDFLYLLNSERQNLYNRGEDGVAIRPGQGLYYVSSHELQRQYKDDYGYDFSLQDVEKLLDIPQGRYKSFENRMRTVAEAVMAGSVDNAGLRSAINKNSSQLEGGNIIYPEDNVLLRSCLEKLLKGNVVYNEEATLNSKQEAYDRVMQNPIMINRGSRIVSTGEVISEEVFEILKSLSLVETESLDWGILGGQILMVTLVLAIMALYLYNHDPGLLAINRRSAALFTAFLLPIAIAAYLGQEYQLAPPVYFTAVVVSAYFGYQTAIVVTLAQILVVLPLVNFNPAFTLVAICGSLMAAHYTKDLKSQATLAKLLLLIGVLNLLTSTAYTLMQGGNVIGATMYITTSVISALLSVVAAIGLMPLFEMLFNIVSPASLIELSQPKHPLLKRLFLEAPGTSQHSMMVANLADAGAEAIGADSLLCRVGAYYHDIGKLRNPLYFTENQGDYNPHQELSPEESRDIIVRHCQDGVELGKKYNLPQTILDFMLEHHGTTILAYFYAEASKVAEENGEEAPNPDDYRYRGPIPSSPESAVVMFADSTEAAVKSLKATSMDEVEEKIRQVFQIKLDQNQLVNSGLGFADIEKIIQAFIQVYSGHFHERIKYPDAPKIENYDYQSTASDKSGSLAQ